MEIRPILPHNPSFKGLQLFCPETSFNCLVGGEENSGSLPRVTKHEGPTLCEQGENERGLKWD